jgi:hypothetical protein
MAGAVANRRPASLQRMATGAFLARAVQDLQVCTWNYWSKPQVLRNQVFVTRVSLREVNVLSIEISRRFC